MKERVRQPSRTFSLALQSCGRNELMRLGGGGLQERVPRVTIVAVAHNLELREIRYLLTVQDISGYMFTFQDSSRLTLQHISRWLFTWQDVSAENLEWRDTR